MKAEPTDYGGRKSEMTEYGGRRSFNTSINNDISKDDDDESSGSSSSSNSSFESETDPTSSATPQIKFAAKETKQVNQIKVFAVLVLIVSIVGALMVYFYMTRLEQDLFETSFSDDANKVLAHLGSSFDEALGALDTLSLLHIKSARDTNQTFPFVTIPEFGMYAMKTASLTKAVVSYFVPVVPYEQRLEWEAYASYKNTNFQSWVNTTLHVQEQWKNYYGPNGSDNPLKVRDTIHGDVLDVPYNIPRDGRLNILLPEWTRFPLVMNLAAAANWDWYDQPYHQGLTRMITNRKAVISAPILVPAPSDPKDAQLDGWYLFFKPLIPPDESCYEPISQWYYPILDSVNNTVLVAEASDYPDAYQVKGFVGLDFYWRSLFRDILPESSKGVVVVVTNPLNGEIFTYQIDGPKAKYKGHGDYHNTKYNKLVIHSWMRHLNGYRVEESDYTGLPVDHEYSTYYFEVYPSNEMEDAVKTSSGIIFALSAVALIVFPFVVFLLYDRKVTQQRRKIVSNAQRSDEIISSLFPSTVRDELYPLQNSKNNNKNKKSKNNKNDEKDNDDHQNNNNIDAPIAKLYPETTVLFADIADFTVWASVRDALQVFTLLETIYMAFDQVAKKRKVFKVETVGDSYIAVVGLPEPRSDHAVVMVKFAKDIINEMNNKVLELEVLLGPGTSSLSIRVGLNSGPTTAGVLRGAKGRFQLFGDTVNTASRMESHSQPGRIMCTEQTATMLIAAGKEHWVTKRSDLVLAKGKGAMQCYWCDPTVYNPTSDNNVNNKPVDSEQPLLANTASSSSENEKNKSDMRRLVEWMTSLFSELLKDVIANRSLLVNEDKNNGSKKNTTIDDSSSLSFAFPRDEVSEIIVLPKPQTNGTTTTTTKTVNLDPIVETQLSEYVVLIASMYQDNPFHNFEHACHVVMAAKKLLSRVVKTDIHITSTSTTAYGITSDQLTQFAIIFSALVHDVDHPGVSNAQLVKEQTDVAVMYNNKSVAEQNSVTLAWDLLHEDKFDKLRETIMPTENDRIRFRKLLVNSVLATDLFDRDLKELRESRWNKAFDLNAASLSKNIGNDVEYDDDDSNRRATIVIEHIIQAADVSHTMQHWHIYQKWNRCLLREMYDAYVAGRAEKDPTIGWYDGELWFFDNYVIPLAKKLKTCGVFGVSCDELLDYANRNRAEWCDKGRSIIAETKELIKSERLLVKVSSKRDLLVSAFEDIIAESSPQKSPTRRRTIAKAPCILED